MVLVIYFFFMILYNPYETYAYELYKVKSGDTLYSIGKKFNISIFHIKEINSIKGSDKIKIGEFLKINNTKNFKKLSNVKDVKEIPILYTVKKGDTLYSISRKFKLSMEILKEQNEIKYNTLKVGDILKIKKFEKETINKNYTSFLEDGVKAKQKDLIKNIGKKSEYHLPLENGYIIQEYGEDKNKLFRAGIQIQSKKDQNLYCVKYGKLVFKKVIQGYGLTLIIEHQEGNYTIYSSSSIVSSLKVNTYIKKGSLMGRSRKKNFTLFFQLWSNNQFQDPTILFNNL